MNNETLSNLSSQIIAETYDSTIQVYSFIGSLALLFYVSFLHFPEELKYLWKPKFTLPTCLYLLSKYPLFIYFSLTLVSIFTTSLRLCNDFGFLSQIMGTLSFLGIQGLITVRTYALCHGHRLIMAIALSMLFLTIFVNIYDTIIPICTPPESPSKLTVNLNILNSMLIVLLDVLAFIVVIHRVWGLWRLRRSLRLRSNEDLVTSLLEQGIIRFCFVLFISSANILLSFFAPFICMALTPFQNIFSALILCEFTLDLRRQNAIKSASNHSAIDLPTISFRGSPVQSMRYVLGRLHENIVYEMGERNDLEDINRGSSGEPDNLHGATLDGEDRIVQEV